MSILIQGAKKGQQAQHTPSIIDDTVASISKIKILYALSEGEIKGLANGAASIMLDSTPLLDASGTANFEGVEWEMRHGTVDQTHIAGMPSASSEIGVNTILRSGIAWVRTINNTQLSSINVNVSWSRLSETNDKFDVIGTKVAYVIDVQTDGHGYVTLLDTSITAKTSGRYQRTHNIKLPEATSNWQIRVRKITPDGDGERVFNQMQIDSIAEIIDAKLRYPCTALLYLSFDARTFSNIPKLSVDLQGVYVQIPSNYDPVTRTSTGLWNGTFKQGFTTNPAWHFHNLITNDRYGLGASLQPFMIDKWSLEYIARICDEPVDDGKGGTEPRFECNLYLQKAEQAYQVLQHIAGIFRGLSFWNGSQIIIDADTPRDAAYVITRANVVDGQFIKTGTAASQRHTIAQVAYSNPGNAYETEYAMVRNEAAIAQRGINILDMSAVGCTSEGQAYRMGLAALLTEQNRTQTVSFAMGLDGSIPTVGDRVDIADMMFTGANNGGRISAVNGTRTVITVDRDNVPAIAGDKLIVNLESGKAQSREILSISGRDITVKSAFDPVAAEHVWAINTEEMPTMPFIVMSVTANDDNTQYNYTALQYDPYLYAQIDNGTLIEPKPPSPAFNPYAISAPDAVTVTSRHRVNQGITITTLVITWTQVKDAVAYDVEWRKDDGDWIKMPRTGNISAEIDGVYSGNYLARVRAVSAFEAVSKPTSSMLTAVTGKKGTPPALLSFKATGLLFGMQLNWTFATGSGDTAYTEIQVASAPDVNIAALGQHAYPTDSAVINGLQGNLTQYYRARIVDKLGFKSVWTDWVSGTTDANADKIMDLIQGQIDESSLSTSLTTKIDKIEVIGSAISAETQARIDAILATNTAVNKEVQDRIAAVASATDKINATNVTVSKETQDRIDAILATNTAIGAEQQARIAAIAAANDKIADEAVARANDILATNNKIIAESNVRATGILAANTKINLERDARVADVLAVNTAISTESQARIDAITSANGKITTESANRVIDIKAVNATISKEVTDRVAAVAGIDDKVTATNATITNINTTLTNELGSQAEQINVIRADYKPQYADASQFVDSARSTQWTYAKTVARDNYATNQRITVLQSDVANSNAVITQSLETLVTKDDALAKSIEQVSVKTESNAAAITSEAQARTTADTALSTRIDTVTATTGNNTAAVQAEVVARTDADSALSGQIDTVLSKTGENSAAIVTERQARTDAISAVTTDITALQAKTGANTAAITAEQTARTTADSALTGRIDAMGVDVGSNKAAITSEAKTRADADSAMGLRVDTVSAKTDANVAAITTEVTARTNADTAITQSITTMGAKVDGNKAAIDSEAITRANADSALSGRIDTVVAESGGNKAAITAEVTARTNADSALSGRIDTVTATSGDNKAAIASEVLARTNADSALSTRIDTTAAQTGANTSAITSEVTARTTADTALSGRIDIVSSKTDTNAASITSVSNILTDKIGAQAEQINVIVADYSPEYVDSTKYANAAKSTQWTYAKTVARDNYATNERITALQSSVADSDARITQTLNTLVTKDEALASDVTALQTKTADNAAAIVSERETRTTAISALATDITSLQAKTGENTAAIVTESKARTDADTALSSQLAVLTTTTGDNKTAITSEAKARTDADTALGVRIDAVTAQSGDNKAAITAEITARTNADTALSQRVDTVTAKSNDNAAAIVAEQTTRTSADSALANNITGLQTKTGENTAAIIAEQKARTDADTAITGSVTTLNAKVGTNTAAITAEQTARSDADAALTLSVTALQTKTGENTAAIVTESQARTTADSALASDISALQTSTGDNTAAIVTEQKTRSDADTALSSRITTVTAESSANKSALQTEVTARTTADTALSGRIDTVTAESGSNKTAIQTEVTARTNADSALGQRIDTVSAKTDANAASITTVNSTLTNELGSQAEQINVIRADYKPQYADASQFVDSARSTQWTYAKTVARDNYSTNERITNLQSSVADSNAQITQSLNTLATKDEALASSIDALTVVTGQNSAAMISESQARTTADSALSGRIDAAVAKTGENTAAIANEVLARTNADSALSTSINALQVKSGENTAAIVAEKTARTSADDAMVLDINALQVKAANNTAAIVTEQNVRANADSALSQRIDIVQSSTATAQSAAEQAALDAQTKSAQAKADAIAAANLYATAEAKAKADAAQAAASSDATSKANAAKSAAEAAAALDAKNKADAALAAAKTDATSKADAAQAAATAVANAAQTAANNAATAAGNKGEVIFGSSAPIGSKQLPQNLWIDTTGGKNTPKRWDGMAWVVVTDKAAVDAQAAANAAQSTATEALGKADTATTNIATIKTELTATTSKTNATATSVGTLQTTVGANTASIQTAQSSIDGIKLEYTVKLDANGRIVGYGLVNNAGQPTEFAIRADRFYIAPPEGVNKGRSVFTVLAAPMVANGVTIPAGTYIDGDLLATGTISGDKITAYSTLTAPQINGGQININNNFVVDSNGNVTAKSGTFEGTVLANKISGTIDVESMKRSAWMGGYTVYYSKSVTHDYSSQFDKAYPSTRPSRGSIDMYYSGEGKYYTAAVLFEVDLFVKTPTVVRQMANVVDDFLKVMVNGVKVVTVNATSVLTYTDPRPEQETVSSYTTNNKDTYPLTYTLPAGNVKLQFLLQNTGGPIALILAGDFIDNDNVKFA